MIVTAHVVATQAAFETLRSGGNAADAAAAAAWALAVCEPSGSGLGGQAMVLVRTPDGTCTVLDGHSHGPAAATCLSVSREQQRKGPRSCTVPSMPATVAELGRRFGRLPLAGVLEPAIAAAQEGFAVTRLLRRHVQWCATTLSASPVAARTFLPRGRAPKRGALLRQPELATTLRRLAAHGVDDFYRGGLAREIVRDLEDRGGLLSSADLERCGLPLVRRPLAGRWLGHEVVTVPPPAGGLQILLGLRLVEALDLGGARDDAEWHERVALVVDAVFRDRRRWPLAPEQATPSVLEWMLGERRVSEIAAEARARVPGPRVRAAEGPGDTTHLCVADRDGMVVSLTQSVQSLFGSGVANERLGFFYNNYLSTCPRHRHPAQLRHRARPQSNAAPTLVLRVTPGGGREPWIALGAAGSRRITSSILQVLARMGLRGESLEAAVDAPRVHPTLGGRYMVESRAATPETLARLASRFAGPRIPRAAHSYSMGAVSAIARSAPAAWTGAADPRREGTVRVG